MGARKKVNPVHIEQPGQILAHQFRHAMYSSFSHRNGPAAILRPQ